MTLRFVEHEYDHKDYLEWFLQVNLAHSGRGQAQGQTF